ncbi:MAG: hypothetical protein GY772_24245 [bacterium]|nr:hypothetical protein [bacterium]
MLHFEIAGQTCTPWSSVGEQMGWLDPESIAALVWAFSANQMRPDHIIDECTQGFDHEFFASVFAEHYTIHPLKFCPTQLGIPAHRPRKYTHLSSRTSLLPFREDEFGRVAFRELVLDGRVFLQAPPDLVSDYVRQLGESRGIPAPAAGMPHSSSAVMPVSDRLRKDKFVELAKRRGVYQTREVIVNVTQNADYWGSLMSVVPTLLRRSRLYALSLDRGFLPLEHFVVQGLPLFLPEQNEYAGLLAFPRGFLQSLSPTQMRHLTGNSMALPAVGSVLAFVIACSGGSERVSVWDADMGLHGDETQ